MVGHGGSSAGSYLADPTSPIPSHCASIVVTSTLRVNIGSLSCDYVMFFLMLDHLGSLVYSYLSRAVLYTLYFSPFTDNTLQKALVQGNHH